MNEIEPGFKNEVRELWRERDGSVSDSWGELRTGILGRFWGVSVCCSRQRPK